MTAPRVLRVGLTGGIASGKSTVAGFLRELGATVVDADRIVHEALGPGGAAREAVEARFGTADRAALGRIIFADAAARKHLEAILHPLVRKGYAERAARWRPEDGDPIVVLDAALLVETGMHANLDRLIVARCSREAQIERLMVSRGLARLEAEARVAAQAPLETKLAVADYVIDTDTSIDATRERTMAIYGLLLKETAQIRL